MKHGIFADPSDAAAEIDIPPSDALFDGHNNAPPTPVVVPDESIEAQSAQNGPGGPGSVVAETSGGLTINLIFDAAAMAAPASFRAGIEQAAALLSTAVSDKITVNLKIDYSKTGGGAAGGPDTGQWESYSSISADLINNATPGDTTFNALPSGSTIQGQSNVAVWNAQLKLWGLLGANDTTTDDGSATFATDINSNLLVGVALHELTHAMGRVPYGPQPDIFDLYRFTSAGTRLFVGGATAPAAYFSSDGGNPNTKLADYGQTSDSSDFLNSGVQGPNDPFNEFYSNNTLQTLTGVDLKQLDALGFHLASSLTTVVEAQGSTSLVELGNNYFLNSISSGLGPELKYGGSPVVTGEFTAAGGGTWTLIGAEQTASGHEVAWKVAGVDQYTVWNVDSSGNYISNSILPTSGTSLAIESVETSFHQDLNGDGVIGVPSGVQPASTLVSQQAAVTVVNNDTFVFAPGSGATAVANAGSPPMGEAGAFLQNVFSEQVTLFHDALGPTQAAFVWGANDGHETFNFVNHDSITQLAAHIGDLHAGFILVH